MAMLSNSSKYAIRALIYLALNENGNKIGIKKIAKDLDIPSPFLGKILQSLVKYKMLESSKGPNGGFSLGKSAGEIYLIDIVEIIDGLDFFDACLIGLKSCSNGEENMHCPTHGTFGPIRAQIKKLFKEESIGILANKIKEGGGSIEI
jgi:Rrf2 family protein